MRFAWFLALRYLKPKRTFISIITVISVLGVALGVGVLLVVIAVMSGFEKRIKEEFLKAEPAIIVYDDSRGAMSPNPAEPSEGPPEWRTELAKIKQHPEVIGGSPMLVVTSLIEKKPTDDEQAVIDEDGTTKAADQAVIIAIDPADTAQMERLQKLMEQRGGGSFELAGESMVVNQKLYDVLQRQFPVILGDSRANVYGQGFLSEYSKFDKERRAAQKKDAAAQEAVENRDRDLPLPEEYVIQGVIDEDKLGEQPTGFVSLKNGQKLAGAGKNVDGLTVELKDPFRAGEVSQELQKSLPPHWRPVTWMQRHKTFFDAIANERGMMYIVLGFISLVAAFCICNTMITMAVQKRREIGMMRALGARTMQILGLFAAKGLIVAFLGVGAGYVLGMTVLKYRNGLRSFIAETFNWQIFDERIYGLRDIPADPRPMDNLIICGIAFVLCSLAALPPAFLVGRMDPAKALRSDR